MQLHLKLIFLEKKKEGEGWGPKEKAKIKEKSHENAYLQEKTQYFDTLQQMLLKERLPYDPHLDFQSCSSVSSQVKQTYLISIHTLR